MGCSDGARKLAVSILSERLCGVLPCSSCIPVGSRLCLEASESVSMVCQGDTSKLSLMIAARSAVKHFSTFVNSLGSPQYSPRGEFKAASSFLTGYDS